MFTRAQGATLLLVLLLALAARLAGLGEGYWIDEVISADTAALPLTELLARSGLADVHPPGYYLTLKIWGALFGSADLAGRLLSLVLALASIALTMAYATRRYGSRAGIFTGLLLALSPLHAHYSVEVRSYVLLAGLIVAALWALELFLERPHKGWTRALLVGLLGALLWTHNLGLLLAALVLLHGLRVAPDQARESLRALAWLSAALFGPWLPLLLVQVRHQPEAMTAHLGAPFGPLELLAGLGPAPLGVPLVLGAALGAWALLGASWGLGQRRSSEGAPPPSSP